jgi:hypothetical protein
VPLSDLSLFIIADARITVKPNQPFTKGLWTEKAISLNAVAIDLNRHLRFIVKGIAAASCSQSIAYALKNRIKPTRTLPFITSNTSLPSR